MMTAQTNESLDESALTRWWTYVPRSRVFCGPSPHGHHLPAIRDLYDGHSTVAECRSVTRFSAEVQHLRRLWGSGQREAAQAYRDHLLRRGIDLPFGAEEASSGAAARPAAFPCGNLVFMFAVTGGFTIVASVGPAEREALKDLQSPSAQMDYLGIFAQTAHLTGDAAAPPHPPARPPRRDHRGR